jgi:hypothetical protein
MTRVPGGARRQASSTGRMPASIVCFMRGGRWTGWVHMLVLALVLPIACSSAFPAFARLVVGSSAHACACEHRAGHSTCGCPICEHRADRRLHRAVIRGTCGEDDLYFGPAPDSAIAPAGGVAVLAPEAALAALPEVAGPGSSVFLSPPTPPPRRAFC